MREQHSDAADTMKWIRRGGVIALLVIGWGFILRANHFHIGPAVVFICLAYFAGVMALYTLYRVGAAAVAANNEEDDAMSWVKPLGALDELDREKRALLKAIKEAEFDLQMGKLSKADADAMIAIYRGRAIEVIKEIDVQNSTSGKVGSVRDQILREARARIQIEEKAAVAPAKKKDKKDKNADKAKQRADKLADAVNAAKDVVKDAAVKDAAAKDAAAKDDAPSVDAKATATPVEADGDSAEDDAAKAASDDKATTEIPDAADVQSSSDAKSEAKEAAR